MSNSTKETRIRTRSLDSTSKLKKQLITDSEDDSGSESNSGKIHLTKVIRRSIQSKYWDIIIFRCEYESYWSWTNIQYNFIFIV